MPARYAAYPLHSGGQWPQQLYQYPQYAPPYGWGYPPYPPQYAGVPAMGNPYPGYPVSPRQGKKDRRRSLSPSEDIKLNELLGGRYRPTTIWDISQDVSTARHVQGRSVVDRIPEALLSKPATEPPVSRMRIISDDFPWEVKIVLARDEIVTVAHIFVAIYGTLQNPLEREDWDEETPNGKRNLHRSRCARLAKGAVSFKVETHVKKVDVLGDKTFFMGLKPFGPADQPEEWLLKLGPPPKQGRR